MKIETNENGDIVLQEVFNTLYLKTEEGNTLGICMRDDTFEIKLVGSNKLYRVNVANGEIDLSTGAKENEQRECQACRPSANNGCQCERDRAICGCCAHKVGYGGCGWCYMFYDFMPRCKQFAPIV